MHPEGLTPENLRTETELRTSRSGGSGGQHVNKTETKVTLRWNLRTSRLVTEEEKVLLENRLAARLHADGILQVSSAAERSQAANRESAEKRLLQIIRRGLVPEKERKATRKPLSANNERLKEKKLHSGKKLIRSRRFDSDSD